MTTLTTLKKITTLTAVLVLFGVAACDRGGPHKALSKQPTPPAKSGAGGVSYSDVQPIFKARCSRCHPAVNPPNWQDYEDAKERTEGGTLSQLYKRIEAGIKGDKDEMPQQGSPESKEITSEERKTLMAWAAAGGPESAEPALEQEPVTTISREQELVNQCTACHGALGISTVPTYPILAGQSSEYLKTQLLAFRSEQRKNPLMNPIAKQLSDSDIDIMVNYFSQAPPVQKAGPTTMGMDVKGAELVATKACAACHLGPGNKPAAPVYPMLAGQHREYIEQQLQHFRSGERDNPIMKSMAMNLTDDEIKKLAEYISSLSPQQTKDPTAAQ